MPNLYHSWIRDHIKEIVESNDESKCKNYIPILVLNSESFNSFLLNVDANSEYNFFMQLVLKVINFDS